MDTNIEEVLQKIGIGPRPVDDPFFDDSYKICRVFERKGITVEDDEEFNHPFMKTFPCSIFGCKATFQTLVDFEIHYNGCHRYTCIECKKILPTARILEIHTEEKHDSFFQVAAKQRPMYQCFDSACNLKFEDPTVRREHGIKVHKFPKNFRYDEATYHKNHNEKLDKMECEQAVKNQQTSKKHIIRLNKNSTKTFINNASVTMPVNRTTTPQNVPLEPSTPNKISSSLVFIPRQIMQKSYSKVLTKKEDSVKNVLETETMMDLAESLPE
ncbi:zinc finger protein 511 [Orussus abietinus]|uniref:zinc finger protein 511 n=1 Tax=Orussus abietinus TaxID=222816 RepID=UPI00062619E4|nr:zinc finger protein 511 [Orussus abietinus]XP_012278844.1 zinc finger protein 511 [Orussus abietinus]XP_012278845.1 zinc finger protein 511 [Orussus abietinus]